MIIQSGIKEVVYLSDKHHEAMSMKASRKLLSLANVSLVLPFTYNIFLFTCSYHILIIS
jgi:deoxycytidylate deaminase